MPTKAIFGRFIEKYINREYSTRSLLLNVEIDEKNHFQFNLFHNGKQLLKDHSKTCLSEEISEKIKGYVDEITPLADKYDMDSLLMIQSKISSFTDDFFPKSISDLLINNRDQYRYLVIEDDEVPINIPYGILFFPEKKVDGCLTDRGFFLSEYYTIVRSNTTNEYILDVNRFATFSTDDLDGSITEENELIAFFENKKPGITRKIESIDDLDEVLQTINPNCLHFCCHGSTNCQIFARKNGNEEIIEMDFFNLHRFPKNTFINLNICSSAYTQYDNKVPRSIANKLLNRNANLIVMTEWPISDSFAYLIGTGLYKRILKDETVLQAIHSIKKEAVTKSDKLTAITYSLRGNPNLRLSIN
jgi:hypothetical protein